MSKPDQSEEVPMAYAVEVMPPMPGFEAQIGQNPIPGQEMPPPMMAMAPN